VAQVPLAIYVSGPYTVPPGTSDAEAAEVIRRNIEAANETGLALVRKGHYPFVPHTMFAGWEDGGSFPRERVLEICLYWVRKCDGLCFIASSEGAELERNEAVGLGIPVYRNLVDVAEVGGSGPTSLSMQAFKAHIAEYTPVQDSFPTSVTSRFSNLAPGTTWDGGCTGASIPPRGNCPPNRGSSTEPKMVPS